MATTSSWSIPKRSWSRRRFLLLARPACRCWTSTFGNRRWRTCSCRSRDGMAMSFERIRAVLLQEAYITGRSVEVIVDLPFWSLMTVVVFGFVTTFLATVMDRRVAQYLYLGTLMWEIMRITQYSMSLGALWNVWSHNFANMFIAPLSMTEYVVAQMLSGDAAGPAKDCA